MSTVNYPTEAKWAKCLRAEIRRPRFSLRVERERERESARERERETDR